MSAMSPLVSHDQDALRCPADITVGRVVAAHAPETEVVEDAVFLCPTQAITLTQ
jgi:ferredoxin